MKSSHDSSHPEFVESGISCSALGLETRITRLEHVVVTIWKINQTLSRRRGDGPMERLNRTKEISTAPVHVTRKPISKQPRKLTGSAQRGNESRRTPQERNRNKNVSKQQRTSTETKGIVMQVRTKSAAHLDIACTHAWNGQSHYHWPCSKSWSAWHLHTVWLCMKYWQACHSHPWHP